MVNGMEKAYKRRHKRKMVGESILTCSNFIVVDLSESGMGLSSLVQRSRGENIPLTLGLDGEELALNSEIIWCRESVSIYDNEFHYGVEFEVNSIFQLQ